jgi:hypothetical protein
MLNAIDASSSALDTFFPYTKSRLEKKELFPVWFTPPTT